ncbi:hypothetical protein M783_10230 [Neisseria gonorrhoeae MU_NG18]|nr:hypothetical protein M783_10230 [Neisseria gonorrhoeae MU_NG18]
MAFSEIQKRKAAGLPAFNMPFYMGVCFIFYIIVNRHSRAGGNLDLSVRKLIG